MTKRTPTAPTAQTVRLLRSMRQPRTIADLATEHGTTWQSIRRWIDALIDADVPIEITERPTSAGGSPARVYRWSGRI